MRASASQLGRQRDENATAGAVVAAERGLRLIDDPAPRQFRLGPGAQRHGVHVRHEHDPRLVVHRAAAGKIDNEVAGLRRHRNAGVGVVEADRVRRHAAFFQCRGEFAPYRGLLSGHALDGEEAHEAVSGGFDVDRHEGSFDERTCEHPSGCLASQGSSKRLPRVIWGKEPGPLPFAGRNPSDLHEFTVRSPRSIGRRPSAPRRHN